METIEINWQKIFESNPKGLTEWVILIGIEDYWDEAINNSNLWGGVYGVLNEKALDLIFWLNEKGIHISVKPVFNSNQVLIFDRRNEDYYTYTVDGTWEIIEPAIEQHFNNYQTPLALGIEFAFELLAK